jgi:RNA-directed DNA polymerase
MDSVTPFIEGALKLKVNLNNLAVDRPWKRKFLEFSLTLHKEQTVPKPVLLN